MSHATMQLALPRTDPASAMAEFEQILASNSGEDPFDSAIKLLAAKLFAELQSRPGKSDLFSIQKSPEATHKVVQELYRASIRKWPLLDGNGNSLGITPEHLVRSMRPLVGWRLIDSDLSWLDATLERLVARDAKGALGQYFTPREVIRFCIAILNPHPKDKIIDPACGSAGFLFEAIRYSIKKHGSSSAALGIDFGARAIKVAALLAAAMSEVRFVISKANSIDGRAYVTSTPPEWKEFLRRDSAADTKRARSWGSWNKLGCSLLLTNPPFAGVIDEPDVLDAYEGQNGRNAVTREHLFLERSVQLLKPGGRLAIVLPQGILSNPSASHLRKWLFKRCRVLGVIGLHPHSFLPYTSVKTALLFAVKHANAESREEDYPIFFATSRNAGKDSRGRTAGSADYGEIAKFFRQFLASEGFDWADCGPSVDAHTQYETVSSAEVLKLDRLDAEYYDAEARAFLRRLDATSAPQIASYVDVRPERFKKSLYRDIKYLDISSVDGRTGLSAPAIIEATKAPSRASYIVQPGDVLVSTVRPERNAVALVTESPGLPIIASNGFCVLRPRTVSPEVLFAYCKTSAFVRMLSRHATASMYPTVTDKDVLGVPFNTPSKELSERVTKLVRSGLEMMRQGQQQIDEAVATMSGHVEKAYPAPHSGLALESILKQSRKKYHAKKRGSRR